MQLITVCAYWIILKHVKFFMQFFIPPPPINRFPDTPPHPSPCSKITTHNTTSIQNKYFLILLNKLCYKSFLRVNFSKSCYLRQQEKSSTMLPNITIRGTTLIYFHDLMNCQNPLDLTQCSLCQH